MDHKKLADSLSSWMSVGTWRSGHAADEKRFNLALQSAFQELGVPIFAEDFREAMRLAIAESGGNFDASEEVVNEYAAKGGAVSEYLDAIGKK
ncbi:hypothetical protein [Herbaspirillum rubrisubalbicans]|uniref:hypothetical protein n=1 Tax=Herbaspirillum rubrisubalbicans TaxID=80842 RepID=UPI0015C54E69|nr:hypothetical protein [Herbaspirillum rubrisubalbicans]NQE51863.1 hypothetical protein [Herbaspirillum rubrisubalbicans]